ncbi:uncharacterized protein [Dermacentor andersoni]|uniref:uncharacterized protein n=1 Tax=Dermacentor andersoni TaxID=34620 RepID=UPI003B3B49E4
MKHMAMYLDDILVTGINDRDHLQNLHNILARLQAASLKLTLEKCIFPASSVEYLGYVISQPGLTLVPCRVDAVPNSNVTASWTRKESLVLMFRFKRFHQYLWGQKVKAITDDKLLLGLLGPDKAVPLQASPRLAAYSYQLVNCLGKDLGAADALSRLPVHAGACVPRGAAERVVQTIKDKFKKCQAGDFRTQVVWVLFQY